VSDRDAVLDGLRRDLEAAADAVTPPPVLRFRSMFGGVGVYADGPMFAAITEAGLALKLPPADRETLIEHWGTVPFQYRPNGPISKNKILIPDEVRSDPDRLAPWLERSIDFAAADAPKPDRKRAS
jgi:DNA transformation protein